MSDTPTRTRRIRDRSDERPMVLSIPGSIDKRALAYNRERAPHLSYNAFICEALVFFLDAKGAPHPGEAS